MALCAGHILTHPIQANGIVCKEKKILPNKGSGVNSWNSIITKKEEKVKSSRHENIQMCNFDLYEGGDPNFEHLLYMISFQKSISTDKYSHTQRCLMNIFFIK